MIKDSKANAYPVRSALHPVLLWLKCLFYLLVQKKEKNEREKEKVKDWQVFFTPGGSNQPQNLVQKLDNCEVTRKRQKA